jgi:hypothetical protein
MSTLEEPFEEEEEETWTTIKEMQPNKVPCPDAFTG